MGNALNSILAYKLRQDQQKNADTAAIPQAIMAFQQGKQQSQDNLLKQLTLQGTLATHGLRITKDGIQRDESLVGAMDTLKYQDLQSKINQRANNASMINSFMNDNSGSGGTNLPPGTRLNTGNGSLSVPLNPKLTESEQSSISGTEALDPVVKDIEKIVNSGELNSKYGDIGRTAEQAAVDTNIPLLVSKSKGLSTLQSKLAELRKTLPFTEGGKQLTTTEKKEVFSLIKITGKDNDRIISDLNSAMKILRSKSKLAIGGANSAKVGQSVTTSKSYPDGTKATANDGTPVIRKGNKWVAV